MSETLHSEHYKADDGLPFKKAIIDALTANPDGLTVPGVRDWLYQHHHFVTVSTYSWLRSFGHEQTGKTEARASRLNENVAVRYNGWPGDADEDGQVRYALTERLDWWMTRMLQLKQVRSSGFDKLSFDRELQSISGRRNAGIGVYVVGPKPLPLRRGVYYDPLAIDWGERELVWRKHLSEALERKSHKVADLLELLKEADRIMIRSDKRHR